MPRRGCTKVAPRQRSVEVRALPDDLLDRPEERARFAASASASLNMGQVLNFRHRRQAHVHLTAHLDPDANPDVARTNSRPATVARTHVLRYSFAWARGNFFSTTSMRLQDFGANCRRSSRPSLSVTMTLRSSSSNLASALTRLIQKLACSRNCAKCEMAHAAADGAPHPSCPRIQRPRLYGRTRCRVPYLRIRRLVALFRRNAPAAERRIRKHLARNVSVSESS